MSFIKMSFLKKLKLYFLKIVFCLKDYNNYHHYYYHHIVIILILKNAKFHGKKVVQRSLYRHNIGITRSILKLLSPAITWTSVHWLSTRPEIPEVMVISFLLLILFTHELWIQRSHLTCRVPFFKFIKYYHCLFCASKDICYPNWDVSVAVLNILCLLTHFIFTKLQLVFPISCSLLSFSLLSLSSSP